MDLHFLANTCQTKFMDMALRYNPFLQIEHITDQGLNYPTKDNSTTGIIRLQNHRKRLRKNKLQKMAIKRKNSAKKRRNNFQKNSKWQRKNNFQKSDS